MARPRKRHCSNAAADRSSKRTRRAPPSTGRMDPSVEQENELTSEAVETRTIHPSIVLQQVSGALLRNQHLQITLPTHTTLSGAIDAVTASVRRNDEPLFVMPDGVRMKPRQRREQAALQMEHINANPGESVLGPSIGLPIRSDVDLNAVQQAAPLSSAARQRLRDEALRMTREPWRDPYISLRAGLIERYLPIVRAQVTAQAIDPEPNSPTGRLTVPMIWDTGSHRTIIARELLSVEFVQSQAEPYHDPYRSGDNLCVQIDAIIALSNSSVPISCVALIVPKSSMPNQYEGMLFGQFGGIDRLNCRSVPRELLLAKGQDISDEYWGDVIIEEYLNPDGDIVAI